MSEQAGPLHGDAFVLLDKQGVIRYASPSVDRWLGRGRLEGAAFGPLVLATDRERLEGAIARLDGGGDARSLHFRMTRAGDELLPVHGRIRHVSSPDNGGWTAVELRPLTPESLAEEAGPRLSAEGFEELAAHLREVLWVANRDLTRIDYVSPSFADVWGISSQELIDDPLRWQRMVHPDDRQAVENAVATVGEGYELDFRIQRPDGTLRWIHTDAIPIYDDDGEIDRLCGIAEDITASKQAEAERAESEAVLSALNATVMGVVVLLQDEQIIYANPRIEDTLGFPPEHFIGRKYWSFAHPEDQADMIDRGRRRVQGEAVANRFEARIEHAAGGYRWIDFSARLLHLRGRPTTMVTGFDVTEHKRALEEVRRREAILSAVSHAAGRFLGFPQVDDVMDDVLRLLGEATNVSRVYVFQNARGDAGEWRMSQRFEWCAPGVEPQIENPELQDLPYVDGLEELEVVLSQNAAFYGVVKQMNAGLRAILEPQQIASIAMVPVFVDGEWWGFIGFDDCATERRWSPPEIDALKVAAGTMAAALERNRAADALRRGELMFRTLTESANAAILMHNFEHGILYANSAAEEMTGRSRDELNRTPAVDLIHPDWRDAVVEWGERRRAGEPVPPLIEVVVPDTQGVDHWVEMSSGAYEIDEQIYVISTAYDITERKQAEEALRRSERTLSTLIGNLPGATFRVLYRDGEWVLDFISAGIEGLTGHAPETLLHDRELLRSLLLPGELERRVDVMLQAMEDRRPYELTYRIRHKDGRELTIGERGQFVVDDEGRAQFGVGFLADITREQELQSRWQYQEKMAAIGLLAAGVAHEIGNPLSGMSMAIESLSERLNDEYAQRKLTTISEHVERLTRIVRQMSDFARQPSTEKSVCRVDELVEKALAIARFDKRSRAVDVNEQTHGDLPPIHAAGDQLVQVFLNLALNAFDAMAGAPEPRRLDIDIGAEDDRIRVTFRDTGPGLSADAAHRVFEPFYTTKAMGRGTGLGLAVSFRIVEEHGGLLAVDSRPGEGACFTVELPTKKDES